MNCKSSRNAKCVDGKCVCKGHHVCEVGGKCRNIDDIVLDSSNQLSDDENDGPLAVNVAVDLAVMVGVFFGVLFAVFTVIRKVQKKASDADNYQRIGETLLDTGGKPVILA